MTRSCLGLFSIVVAALAQTPDPHLVFEAASIKPSPPAGARLKVFSGCMDEPGRVNCEYATPISLLMRAYHVKASQIAGPSWLETSEFDIVAKLPPDTRGDQIQVMFQNLLSERFHLVLHHETRDLPVYSLGIAKGGSKLQASPGPPSSDPASSDSRPEFGDDGFPVVPRARLGGGAILLFRNGRVKLQGADAPISSIVDALSGQLDRLVVDDTGLSGKFDFTADWSAKPPTTADTPGDDLFSALEHRLGLKLSSKKAPADVLVIDRFEKSPSEN